MTTYGFACVSDAADLMLSMLKHLNEQYGENIALPVNEQEHLSVFTLALLVIIRKVRAGEIQPETLQVQSLYFNPAPDTQVSKTEAASETETQQDNVIQLNSRLWAMLKRTKKSE